MSLVRVNQHTWVNTDHVVCVSDDGVGDGWEPYGAVIAVMADGTKHIVACEGLAEGVGMLTPDA